MIYNIEVFLEEDKKNKTCLKTIKKYTNSSYSTILHNLEKNNFIVARKLEGSSYYSGIEGLYDFLNKLDSSKCSYILTNNNTEIKRNVIDHIFFKLKNMSIEDFR